MNVFQLALGYAPHILGVLKTVVSEATLNSHIQLAAPCALQKLLRLRNTAAISQKKSQTRDKSMGSL